MREFKDIGDEDKKKTGTMSFNVNEAQYNLWSILDQTDGGLKLMERMERIEKTFKDHTDADGKFLELKQTEE